MSLIQSIHVRSFVVTLVRAFVLLFLCAFVSPELARAQNDDEVVRVNTSLVQLNVGVADRQGRAITNLSRSDFAIYEDGVRQTMLSFEPTSTPFSLALLLDVSGSTLNFRTTLKASALRFIDALAPDDRVAVIAFNERQKVLTKFTADRKKIAFGIELAEGRGGTDLYEALDFALKQLADEGKRRKAIIVLTDGIDTQMRNLDRSATVTALTDEEAVAAINPEASRPLNRVLDAADRQGVTIYPLALPSGDVKRLPIKTPQITAIYTAARARIQSLADRTGGRLNEIRRIEELGRLYAEVAADMRSLYTISYQSSAAQQRDGRWHTIRIEVARSDLIARTRPGYYAR